MEKTYGPKALTYWPTPISFRSILSFDLLKQCFAVRKDAGRQGRRRNSEREGR